MLNGGAKLQDSPFAILTSVLLEKNKNMHQSLSEKELDSIKNLVSYFVKQGYDINANTQGGPILSYLISQVPSGGKTILDLLDIFLKAGAMPNPAYMSHDKKCSALSNLADEFCRQIKSHYYEISTSDQYMMDAINLLLKYGANDSDHLIPSKQLGLLDEYDIEIPQQVKIMDNNDMKMVQQESQIDFSNVISELEQYSMNRINKYDAYMRDICYLL